MHRVPIRITLPEELVQELKALIRPGEEERFIAEAIRQKIERTRRQSLDELLEEGYRSQHEESRRLAEEFEAADLEGWDEY